MTKQNFFEFQVILFIGYLVMTQFFILKLFSGNNSMLTGAILTKRKSVQCDTYEV